MGSNKAEFDKYSSEYEQLHASSVKASGYDVSFFDEQKIKVVFEKIGVEFNKPFTFLNFGCGIGKSEKFIRKYFEKAEIHSADISSESIKIAKERNQDISNLDFYHFENVQSFRPGKKFEVIFVANVFHHIPEGEHLTVLNVLRSLLKKDGYLFIFEHNPLHPFTRHAFSACEFDKGCKMIFPWKMKSLAKQSGFLKVNINYTLFFPKQLEFLSGTEKYLKKIPIGAQYYTLGRG